MTNIYLSFTIHGELYATEVDKVLEVIEKQDFTRVPNAPAVVKGILNFRGNVIPVYDTRIKLNLPELNENANYVIIVVELTAENENIYMGAIVDKVKDVIEINHNEIKPVPPMSKEFNAKYLKGVVKREHTFVMLLDFDKLFSSTDVKETSPMQANLQMKNIETIS